jgi:hypothetical protein
LDDTAPENFLDFLDRQLSKLGENTGYLVRVSVFLLLILTAVAVLAAGSLIAVHLAGVPFWMVYAVGAGTTAIGAGVGAYVNRRRSPNLSQPEPTTSPEAPDPDPQSDS